MDQQEADPTGAFRGGSAGLDDDATGTEYERHAPGGSEPGGGQPNTGSTGDAGDAGAERATIVEGTAATSEIADPEAQTRAEHQGDGTPQPR